MFVTDIVSVPNSNPCGLLETQYNLVKSSHGQQGHEALAPSDTLSPVFPYIHPSPPFPPTGTTDSALTFVPSQSDIPGQLQACKPSGMFQGVLGDYPHSLQISEEFSFEVIEMT